jgi:hypothetical protein
MSMFALLFWICVIIDCAVPGVDISIGWYILLVVLAALED